jgi:hypothetical protein
MQKVAVVSHLTSRLVDMMGELRKLLELIDTNNICICARYIRSMANLWADTLNRETNMNDWQLNFRIS